MNKSISIAKSILGPFYENEKIKPYWNKLELYMDEDEVNHVKTNNKLLINIINRCLNESFNISDFFITEIPYQDKNGVIFCFLHTEDYKKFEEKKIEINEVRCIDFFSCYDGNVTPMNLTYSKNKGFYQEEKSTCKEALYFAFD